MTLRSVATAFGLVGGLCWLVRAFSDHDVLGPAGLVLLGLAALAALPMVLKALRKGF